MKGLCLLFFPNVPGATFIQGATLIQESRVAVSIKYWIFDDPFHISRETRIGHFVARLIAASC